MLDKILAIISFLALMVFMSEVLLSVMVPDLWVVTLIVFAIGIYYFWQDARASDQQGDENAHGNGSER